jgi:hypothetical protein
MIFLVLVFFAVANGKRSQETTHDLLLFCKVVAM